jgi:hypothetical protein
VLLYKNLTLFIDIWAEGQAPSSISTFKSARLSKAAISAVAPNRTNADSICKFYLKGSCKFGEKCALVHPNLDGNLLVTRAFLTQFPLLFLASTNSLDRRGPLCTAAFTRIDQESYSAITYPSKVNARYLSVVS